ncbi:glycoside hydrolase family 16 protein [Stakelama saccharophila]|uniref:Glycoside hydrolase family 16 protein n=1 Tax=Stakelama saccharophila TaxID=3075605 RepID=A0ABZ0B761_9SPHN|nr:glycoside hydrolase family 16 protein [Stakelama sp. W311]WNO53272.1 glycoside hydrolase family 16 protein [Stakelama sp. W311]
MTVRRAAALALGAVSLLADAPAPQDASGSGLSAKNGRVDMPLERPADYRLVWSDEFDSPGLPDPAKWRYDTSRNKQGWYNHEKQYYSAGRPENARIADGKLILQARRERLDDDTPDDYGGQDYTSARLVTRGLAEWKYGFFEVSAKIPCGRGTWPAIWMLGTGGEDWPAQGEIDIMEHVGFDPGVVHGTIHTKAYNHVAGTQIGSQVTLDDACTSFHRYQLDWSPQRILIGVDGRAYMRFANDGSGDHARWPFDRPEYLILNIAVGGDWGGKKGIDPDAFPARMMVDYVRIWQNPGQ